MSYELFIGLRYLKAKRKHSFISIISLISILGVMVGVSALIIVLSVMGGFEEDLKEKILGVNAHIVVLKIGRGIDDYPSVLEKIKEVDGVTGASPFIYNQVMLSSRGGAQGVVVRGIDLETVGDITVLPEKIKFGGMEGLDVSLGGKEGGGLPGILIGKELANGLGLGVGDELNVISPQGTVSAMGVLPRMAVFKVAGIFELGMYEYDSNMAFISLENAQRFFRLGGTVTGIEVSINEIYKADKIAERIRAHLVDIGSYWTRTWMEMNKNLFSALRLEKLAMFIILTLIILVAAFNIISTLVMVVMDKGKDIAILKSMGATSASIMRIFMVEGLIIGLIGTAIGILFGVTIALNLEWLVKVMEGAFNLKLFPASVYYIDKFPSRVEPGTVVVVAVVSIVISFLATLYPSWKASRLDPVEAIRYE